jgi:ribose 5-phosphate isomerase B
MTQIDQKYIQEVVHRVVHETMGTSGVPHPPKKTSTTQAEVQQPSIEKQVIAIGTDHGGVDLKEILKKDLTDSGYTVIDCGTHTKESVDYPDIALAVSEQVASGKAWRGVIIDGAGHRFMHGCQ